MKHVITVGLSLAAGIGIGAAAVQVLHAQARPPAYNVAEITVTNSGRIHQRICATHCEIDRRFRRQVHCTRRQDNICFRVAAATARRHHTIRFP